MDGRERVIRAIELGGPDRLPIRHNLLPGAMLREFANHRFAPTADRAFGG